MRRRVNTVTEGAPRERVVVPPEARGDPPRYPVARDEAREREADDARGHGPDHRERERHRPGPDERRGEDEDRPRDAEWLERGVRQDEGEVAPAAEVDERLGEERRLADLAGRNTPSHFASAERRRTASDQRDLLVSPRIRGRGQRRLRTTARRARPVAILRCPSAAIDVTSSLPPMHALDALGNPVRREILVRLRAKPATVGEIAARFPVSRPAISRHLAMLSGPASSPRARPAPHPLRGPARGLRAGPGLPRWLLGHRARAPRAARAEDVGGRTMIEKIRGLALLGRASIRPFHGGNLDLVASRSGATAAPRRAG